MSEKKKAWSEGIPVGYDSDQDLSEEERKKIRYSTNPKKAREKIWEKKGTWPKLKKAIKAGWYGDKQRKSGG